jgi:hypothetical protein
MYFVLSKHIIYTTLDHRTFCILTRKSEPKVAEVYIHDLQNALSRFSGATKIPMDRINMRYDFTYHPNKLYLWHEGLQIPPKESLVYAMTMDQWIGH